LAQAPPFPEDSVDFEATTQFKAPILRRAAQAFFADGSRADRAAFNRFCKSASPWLDDFALFMALKDAHNGAAWTTWDAKIRQRDPRIVSEWTLRLGPQLNTIKYWQFEFFRQWEDLKIYCGQRHIRLMGDIPIYVAHDSSDVWTNPELFYLDDQGNPTVVSGVPPDYFSAAGQLWGNPIYRWNVLEAGGYKWWIERLRASFALFDLVRLDHFRGFESYWEIPASGATAIHGRWVKAPGNGLLSALQNEFGELPIVAENLGVVTPAVKELREKFGLPGMSTLQFAFGTDPQGPFFRPHNYKRDLIAYTGSHDNDTALGWWSSPDAGDSTRSPDDVRKEREFARAYLNFHDNEEINWTMIRAVEASVADVVVIPLQDVLGLGSSARMNVPGTVSGNWKWRYRPGVLSRELSARLRSLTALYGRDGLPTLSRSI